MKRLLLFAINVLFTIFIIIVFSLILSVSLFQLIINQ